MPNTSLTPAEQAIIDELKISNPEAYNIICDIQSRYKETIKYGCHEIGNILSLISSTYQLMECKSPYHGQDEYWKQLGEDISCLKNCMWLIGKYRYADTIYPKDTSVGELCRKMYSTLKENMGESAKMIKLTCTVPVEHSVFTDADKIADACLFLCQNAVESVSASDTMSIHPVKISVSEVTKTLVVSVSNPGEEIMNEIRGKMFDAFFSTKDGHTGLGLSIVNKSVSALNGELKYRFYEGMNIYSLELPV